MADICTQSVREILEHKIQALEEKTNLRFDAWDHALKLQALEYERRLGILNGEQARLAEERARFVLNEIYEIHRDEIVRFMSGEKARSNTYAFLSSLVIGSGIISALVTYLFTR